MQTVPQDVRYAFRTLARNPGFTLIAVLSLGLGLGVNGAIFTWLKAVYLDPLPGVQSARELATINASFGPGSGGYSNSWDDFVYFRNHSQSFDGMFAHEMLFGNLNYSDTPELIVGGIVSGSYFDVLKTRMTLGRGFLAEEDQTQGTHPVIVFSHGLWQRKFAGKRDILGQQVELNRVPLTVVGVAPEGFAGVYGGLGQEYWVPLAMSRKLMRGNVERLAGGPSWLQIMARLKPGVSLEQAEANVAVLGRQIRELHRKQDKNYEAKTYPLHKAQRGIQSGMLPFLVVLSAAVGVVLLIACLNVANLLLARAGQRSREISVRLSLGADRARLVRQLLTESLALAALGGAAGLLIAVWTAQALPAMVPSFGMKLAFNLALDGWVFGYLLLVTILAGCVFGLLPALETSRLNLVDALKEGALAVTANKRRNTMRQALVAGQVALSLTALVAAGLFTRSMVEKARVKPGFRVDHMLAGSLDTFFTGMNAERSKVFYRELLEKTAAIPGVENVTLATFLPMSGSGGGNTRRLEVEGYAPQAGERMAVVTDGAGPGYFRSMGIEVKEGREFGWEDRDGTALVAMVNETFVRQYFTDGKAVGKRISIGGQWREIAGVYKNYIYRRLEEDPSPFVMVPFFQDDTSAGLLLVRTTIDPSRALAGVRQTIGQLDRGLPLVNPMTMGENVRNATFEQRALSILLTAFGLLAATLAAVGLYGVMAGFVSQRRREIGIRVAIGASPESVEWMVLRQGLRLAGIGTVIGMAGALAVSRLIASMLYHTSPTDPLTLGGVAAAMLLGAALSSYLPARAASRVDPTVALRWE